MFLGIDTSCYTTSLAVVDTQGRLLSDRRQLLKVPAGERGLRQSDGVFQHLQNIPLLAAQLKEDIGAFELKAIGVSRSPRPLPESYMPVFVAGLSYAKTIADILAVPCCELSHQEGHILAGAWSAKVDWEEFYALHVSGGTTELLLVNLSDGIKINQLGGSSDLHAGQFIDRVGVALGLPFPAGPALEKLAQHAGGSQIKVPVAVKGLSLSFSGPESFVQRLLQTEKIEPAVVARGLEQCIAESLRRLIDNAVLRYGKKPVLFVGGVMANHYIRQYLTQTLNLECNFAQANYAGDNAVGAALYALYKTKLLQTAD
ncbi:MAG: O-sialoglycoprotein endopeptidase [Firmicutes bacterium]|nr:O-sialoglycoprotein endopeptidase [Bacillota bacterium]